MWLRIEIDLSQIPENGAPEEAPVIIREIADWLESRQEIYAPTATAKIVRNFESVPCGKVTIC